jgi:hypothetical protein
VPRPVATADSPPFASLISVNLFLFRAGTCFVYAV